MQMKKSFVKGLLAAVSLCATVSAGAYDFVAGGIYYNITSEADKTVEVTAGEDEYVGGYTIPATVNNGGTITVYGAEAGSVISVYTVNGAMVSSTVAADEETVLPVSVDGVLLVKAGEEVIKVVK